MARCLAPPRTRRKLKPRNPNYWRRAMANGWTCERRERQAALIRVWKPWEQSTGPRTVEGKARTSRNGFKGGVRQEMLELTRCMNAWLREHRQALKRVIE